MKIERAAARTHVQFSQRLMEVPVGEGIPDLKEMREELDYYMDVIFGRVEPPVDSPYLTLMEVAVAYYARAKEMEKGIHRLELDQKIPRGSKLYKFRTGELRSAIELLSKVADLGSRRLSQERLLEDQRYDAGI